MKTIQVLGSTDEGVTTLHDGALIAKVHDGHLDVRRPGNQIARPGNVKATASNLMKVFGKWYFDSCVGTAISSASHDGNKIRIPKCPNSDAIVFLYDEDDGFLFHYIGGKCFRVGTVNEKSIVWQYANEDMADSHPAVTRSPDPEEAARLFMRSFKGRFASKTPKAAPAKTSGEKTKAPPKSKKTPAKKAKTEKSAPPSRKSPPKRKSPPSRK